MVAHLVVAVQVENVRDEIEGILVVLDVCIEAGEVEAVGEIVLVDFAKVFVAARRYKLG